MRRVAGGLLPVVLVTTLVFGIGALQKGACANRAYVERGAGSSFQCYTDVAGLYRGEQLTGGRIPYLDRCEPSEQPCDEYPVLTAATMYVTAAVTGSGGDPYLRFYIWNVAILLGCALVIAVLLRRLDARWLAFSAAPVLALYGTINWDLIAVALAMAGTFAFLRRRDAWSGVFLGLGAATKLYPALLVVPFAVDRWRSGDRRRAVQLAGAAGIAWLVTNLPFVLAAPGSWSTFFRFSSERPPDADSLWLIPCAWGWCWSATTVNVFSMLAFIGVSAVVILARLRRVPGTRVWALAFPILVAFMLTNKVWSAQWGLWLLPWFALFGPLGMPFVAYQLSEILVYEVRFSYFGRLDFGSGVPYEVLAMALALRALLLVWCLVGWCRGPAAEIGAAARPPPRDPELAVEGA